MNILPLDFYRRHDTLQIAKDLFLFTKMDSVTAEIMIEIEAYVGITDRACHAYGMNN